MATNADSESPARSAVANDGAMRRRKARSLICPVMVVLLSVLTVPADADVRRNAGRRAQGGMGLDLNWYCKQVHGSASVSIDTDKTATGWRCTKGNQLVGISVEDACRRHYGNNASERLAPTKRSTDWFCVLGLNLDWYCKSLHGQNARSVKVDRDNPRSWKCARGGDLLMLDVFDACRKHYGSSAIAILGRHEDPQAWTCEIK
jgi:hypothetical protein